MTQEDSILDFIPPIDSRKPYRLQISFSLEEAAELEHFLLDPTLPFEGDSTRLVRTFVRAGIMRLHEEKHESTTSFISAMRPMLGSELLKWSSATCDAFALSVVDHIRIASESGDPTLAEDVINKVVEALQEIRAPSAKAMLKKSLIKRGFVQAVAELRQILLDDDHDVYYLDTLMSTYFGG